MVEFILDSIDTMVRPRTYFSAMSKTGGFTRPVVKAAFYGAIAGALILLWTFLGISMKNGMSLSMTASMLAPLMMTVMYIVILFVGAVFTLIFAMICKGDTSFEAVTRVTAALLVVQPFELLLTPAMIFPALTGLIMASVAVLRVWILYNALVYALNGDMKIAKILAIILGVVMVWPSLDSL